MFGDSKKRTLTCRSLKQKLKAVNEKFQHQKRRKINKIFKQNPAAELREMREGAGNMAETAS